MLNNKQSVALNIFDHTVTLTTGVMAKQANGAVTLHCGNLVLLATATVSSKPKEGIDFFPLTVEFSEKMYAAGKIPGGFFKREARPSTESTLIARLIDRPLRPSFPKNLFHDVQIVVTVLSYDDTVAIEPMSIIAASAAVSVSDIPFNGPVGAALVGMIDGTLKVNPSREQLEKSALNLVVAGNKDAILMVEAQAHEVSESVVIDAIMLGHQAIKDSIALQEELVLKAGKQKKALCVENPDLLALKGSITEFVGTQIGAALDHQNKQDLQGYLSQLEQDVIQQFSNQDQSNHALIKTALSSVQKEKIRETIIQKRLRPDGRKIDEIRPIEIDLSVLPSTHGSALFTRGETQSLGVMTLGTSDDEQLLDGLSPKTNSRYYFHYNFPPFSVGEVGHIRTGRRELGHGALAERALKAVLPNQETFPYTLRLVSEIFESNGSSSMASVCSGSLALMDGGVPIKSAVSGIAMGLLMEGSDYIILSDIQGLEDHYGDMDFKVAGTKDGITALQLDIKISGLSKKILEEALEQAKKGRLFILNQIIDKPRASLSELAPKIHFLKINPEKVGLVIGPGGKMIRKIEEESKAVVIVTDGSVGQVSISANNQASLDKAVQMITALTRDVEVGDVYQGTVVKTASFGAFVEILPGKEGLIHISNLSNKRVERVEDVVQVGHKLKVKVHKIDPQNRINLVPIDS